MGKEQAGEVSHEMFDNWMTRNGLSLTTAEALGISRRMVSYYRTARQSHPARHLAGLFGLGSYSPEGTRTSACLADRPRIRRAAPVMIVQGTLIARQLHAEERASSNPDQNAARIRFRNWLRSSTADSRACSLSSARSTSGRASNRNTSNHWYARKPLCGTDRTDPG
ncbi:MAG: hypothetical protein M0C28_32650 [Candidatus Moduliflexus flocculans]|nr:hypothetical protein [Candidatus Moduliflexus flocculans]